MCSDRSASIGPPAPIGAASERPRHTAALPNRKVPSNQRQTAHSYRVSVTPLERLPRINRRFQMSPSHFDLRKRAAPVIEAPSLLTLPARTIAR
jgi:hypothetical protein